MNIDCYRGSGWGRILRRRRWRVIHRLGGDVNYRPWLARDGTYNQENQPNEKERNPDNRPDDSRGEYESEDEENYANCESTGPQTVPVQQTPSQVSCYRQVRPHFPFEILGQDEDGFLNVPRRSVDSASSVGCHTSGPLAGGWS